jgi:hypothetical protein
MWLKGGRSMGPSALVGAIALIAIEYAASGGRFTARPSPDPTFSARLERGPCYGSCPSYSVAVDATGAVRFVGEKSVTGSGVPCQGERRWKIPASAVAKLEAKVDASGFFGFKPAYRAGMTDMPTFTVTVTRRGSTKTVTDYVGLSVGMPQAMVDLENAIDETANDRACVLSPHVAS